MIESDILWFLIILTGYSELLSGIGNFWLWKCIQRPESGDAEQKTFSTVSPLTINRY